MDFNELMNKAKTQYTNLLIKYRKELQNSRFTKRETIFNHIKDINHISDDLLDRLKIGFKDGNIRIYIMDSNVKKLDANGFIEAFEGKGIELV